MQDRESSKGQGGAATAICTLFEGDYHLGLAAFVNSLVRASYTGTVWVGYRGVQPPWLSQLEKVGDGTEEYGGGPEYVVAGKVRLVFLRLDTKLHLTNLKPQFMLDLLANKASQCEYLWYFDPDVFLRCDWAFFSKWQRYGIALCEEIVNYNMAEGHPIRLQWADLGAELGLGKPRLLHQYFSGGMVGVASSHAGFLRTWKRILDWVCTAGYDLEKFKPGAPDMPFNSTDQDALNMAAMYTDLPLTTMGPDAMGFVPSGYVMYHAVGQKPWRGSFLMRALAGYPPSGAAKYFLTQVSTPIRAYSPLRLFGKRVACGIAAAIGRFYRRG